MAIQYDENLHAERSPLKVMLEHSVLLVFLCTLIGAAAQILLEDRRDSACQRQSPTHVVESVDFLRICAVWDEYGFADSCAA